MPKLYVIPTPIGNLEDITLRALKVLKEVDLVLAEDTRQISKLLQHFEINTAKRAYHQHNEHKLVDNIVKELKDDDKIFALVSDAGTPAISDPGYLIVKKCIENNIKVECLPGATAFIPALVESGLPSTTFCFEGFLPHKKGRTKKLKELEDETRTMIFYESPYRLLKTLKQFTEYFGADREASISRELTKIYAETISSTIGELLKHFENNIIKGEFVIIINGKK
ncbi:MAG: 16S rRNA (cytidine(1402)-2'-O)-methyltransferase [Bacteroidota bacterium]|nr:16S rRNA (cytidine(1402)-2'-O)-methyltransferase [Bacteroidota bacterium]